MVSRSTALHSRHARSTFSEPPCPPGSSPAPTWRSCAFRSIRHTCPRCYPRPTVATRASSAFAWSTRSPRHSDLMSVPPLNHVRRVLAGRLISAVVVCAGMLVLTPCPTQAELVRLSAGRTLSVKGHRDEGASVVLLLRSGGEIVCPRDLVVEILPDEVPYPEPVTDEASDG